MIEMIVAVYAGICWLIFIKLKLLPWNFTSKIIVYSLPIFGVIVLILTVNYFAPSTADIRVINRSVDINPQVLGRVNKVYVVTNQEVKKGDTLITLDPTPYLLEIKSLEAKLKTSEAALTGSDKEIEAARGSVLSISSQLDLAKKRAKEYQTLVNAGAANRFDLEKTQTDISDLTGKLGTAQAQLEAIKARIGGVYDGGNSNLAEIIAKIDQAKWNLKQTVILAPTDGNIPNVSVNTGAILSPFKSAFVLIQKEQSILGLFAQNELQAVKPGNEVEISLRTEPGIIIKARLEYVIDATNQGIMNNASGMFGAQSGIPDTSNPYPSYEGKLAAKFIVEDSKIVLTTGARGSAAIYSDRAKLFHIIRKVMVRVNSKMNYIIPKLH
jgi:multidrug resistance efflux pump